jgi:hypothetical protein
MTLEEFKVLQGQTSLYQRNWLVQNAGRDSQVCVIKKTESSYYETTYKITYNQSSEKLFLREISWKGFKIGDKIKNTWIKDFDLTNIDFCKKLGKEYGFDWLDFETFGNGVTLKLPKGCWTRILCKKFTNNNQVLDYLSIYRFKLKSHDKGLKRKAAANLSRFTAIPYLNITAEVTDIANMEIGFTNTQIRLLRDISMECFVLGRKFNPNWSLKRLSQFHQDNIKELSMSEAVKVPDITYKFDLTLPEGYTHLKTALEVFWEAKTLSHCLYSNYHKSMVEEKYIAIHSDKHNATIGISRLWRTNWQFDQIHGAHNSFIPESEEIKKDLQYVVDELNSDNKKESFKMPEKAQGLFVEAIQAVNWNN